MFHIKINLLFIGRTTHTTDDVKVMAWGHQELTDLGICQAGRSNK